MALDPSIILGVKAPELPNPLQQFQAISQAKDAAQMRQARGLEILGLERQNANNAAQDAAFSHNTTIDPTTSQPSVNRAGIVTELNKGGWGRTSVGLQADWQKQDLAKQKAMLDDQKTQLENAGKKNELLGGVANGILALPPEQQPIAYAMHRAQLIQQGIVGPNDLPPDFNPQFVQGEQAQSMKAAEVIAAHAKKVDQDQASLKLAQEAANNAINQQLSQQRNTLEARGQDLSHADRRAQLSIEAGRLHMEQAKNSFDQNGALETQAQQIAMGDVKGLSLTRNNPYTRQVMQRVYEINPNYSDQLYSTKQDFLSSKGKANAQVQSLNKLSAHLGELQSASENAGFSPTGMTSAGNNLRLAEQLFSKEDVKFLSGAGVGTEGELNKLVDRTHSPLQSVRDSAIQTLSKFTADAARQLGDQYERGTKLKFDPTQHFTPDTVRMLETHGGTSARGPAEGTEKTNSHGDTIVYRGGKWQIK